MTHLTPYEEKYNISIPTSRKDYPEDIELHRSVPDGRIKIKLFEERWRTAKDTVKMLEDFIIILKALR